MKKSKRKGRIVRRLLFCAFPILLIFFMTVSANAQKQILNENKRFTGDIFSYNGVANLYDAISLNQTDVFSPYSFYKILKTFYGIVDNQTKKEFSNYIKMDDISYSNKVNSLVYELNEKKETSLTRYYEELMKEFSASSYDSLTISKLQSFNSVDKEKLLILLNRINASIVCIDNDKKCSVKSLKNITFSKQDITLSAYEIKLKINECMDYYETYMLSSSIKEMHDLIINSDVYDSKKFKKEFDVDVQYLSFSDNVSLNVNDLVKKKTDDKVDFHLQQQELIEIDSLYLDTFLFESFWQDNILKQDEMLFTDYKQEMKIVPTLYFKTSYYLENSYAIGFEKEYENSRYSFVGILPKNINNVSLSSLSLDSLMKSKQEKEVFVSIPKFVVDTKCDYKSVLSKLGISDIFNSTANFNKWSSQEFYMDKILGRYSFTLAEKGSYNTELVHDTLQTFSVDVMDKELNFNRPFYFLVIDNDSSSVLYVGKISEIK